MFDKHQPTQNPQPESPVKAFAADTNHEVHGKKFASFEDCEVALLAVQQSQEYVPRLDAQGVQRWRLQIGRADQVAGDTPFTLSDDFSCTAGYTFHSLRHGLEDLDLPVILSAMDEVLCNMDTVPHEPNKNVVRAAPDSLTMNLERFYRSSEALFRSSLQYLCLLTGTIDYLSENQATLQTVQEREEDDVLNLMTDAVEWRRKQILGTSVEAGKVGLGIIFKNDLRKLTMSFNESVKRYEEDRVDEHSLQVLAEAEQQFEYYVEQLEELFSALKALCIERREVLDHTEGLESSWREFGGLIIDFEEAPEKSVDTEREEQELSYAKWDTVSKINVLRNGISQTVASYLLRRPFGNDSLLTSRLNSLNHYIKYEFDALQQGEEYEEYLSQKPFTPLKLYLEDKVSCLINLAKKESL